MNQTSQDKQHKESSVTLESISKIAPSVLKEQEKNKTKCDFLVIITMTSFLSSCSTNIQAPRYNSSQPKRIKTYKIKENIYSYPKNSRTNKSRPSSEEQKKFQEYFSKGGTTPYKPKEPSTKKKGKWHLQPVQYDASDIKEHSRKFNKELRGRNRLFLFSFLLMLSPILLAI